MQGLAVLGMVLSHERHSRYGLNSEQHRARKGLERAREGEGQHGQRLDRNRLWCRSSSSTSGLIGLLDTTRRQKEAGAIHSGSLRPSKPQALLEGF
jgi:hypothetical protein